MLRHLTETIDPHSAIDPDICMTDNDDGLRNALKAVWQGDTLFLCLFHVLQTVWRYLFTNNSGIAPQDRQLLFSKFKRCVYAKEEEVAAATTDLFEFPVLSIGCTKYFSDFWKYSQDWILVYRSSHLTRGCDTNNYCESAVRAVKESIMLRTKAVSLGQLLINLTRDHDLYYSTRLLDTSAQRSVHL